MTAPAIPASAVDPAWPELTTTEVADLTGLDCHLLSAAMTKLWWFYLQGQEATVGSGGRRSFSPVDVVVIDMLAATADLGGDLVSTVRAEFAEQIYAAWDSWTGAGPLVEVLRHPRVGDGRVGITFQPAWFLIDRAVHAGAAR